MPMVPPSTDRRVATWRPASGISMLCSYRNSILHETSKILSLSRILLKLTSLVVCNTSDSTFQQLPQLKNLIVKTNRRTTRNTGTMSKKPMRTASMGRWDIDIHGKKMNHSALSFEPIRRPLQATCFASSPLTLALPAISLLIEYSEMNLSTPPTLPSFTKWKVL